MTAMKLNFRFIDVNAEPYTPEIKGMLFIAVLLKELSASKYDSSVIWEM